MDSVSPFMNYHFRRTSSYYNNVFATFSKKNKKTQYIDDILSQYTLNISTLDLHNNDSPVNVSHIIFSDDFDITATNPPKKKRKERVYPRSNKQQYYVDAMNNINTSLIFGIGPAGTGKTLFACDIGIKFLKQKLVDKIIITRPLVSVEKENVGFLPGDMKNKMDPWTRPIIDILVELLSKSQVDTMIKNGVIEISPLAYMRGRTFKKAWIIADEMQNSSPNQMKMLLTRIGNDSKIVVNGDLCQSDFDKLFVSRKDSISADVVANQQQNGLSDFILRYTHYCNSSVSQPTDIDFVYLDASDIQRSPIVSTVFNIYNTSFSNDVLVTTPELDDYTPISKNNDAALIPLHHNSSRFSNPIH